MHGWFLYLQRIGLFIFGFLYLVHKIVRNHRRLFNFVRFRACVLKSSIKFMILKKLLYILSAGLMLFPVLFLNYACRKDAVFSTDASAHLKFSTDTLRIDTVFTNIGSAVRYFKIFNNYDQSLRISKISITQKTNTIAHLNVDGVSGNEFANIEIAPHDSIYVFATVTVNPNAPVSDSPFVIDEDINFVTNGSAQKVVVEAWGQNANYIPDRFSKGTLALLSGHDATKIINWNDKKPYVIYGGLFVDSCVLRIAAGTKIHVHGGFGQLADHSSYRDGIIYVLQNAHIEALGTKDNPIIFQGDRLEQEFIDVPDQWAGIIMSDNCKGNIMNYTTVRNSRVGIRTDSSASLALKNCKIYNTASSGLLTQHSNVTAENCLFYNNGVNGLQIEFGGDYQFTYCTFSSLGSRNVALSTNNYRCYAQTDLGVCTQAKIYRANLAMTNCIIFGGNADVISFANASADNVSNFNYGFTNCIVRVKDLLKVTATPDFLKYCTNCINITENFGTYKLFKNTNISDYHLDSLSIAHNQAFPQPKTLIDLDAKNRDTQKPDIGCYEFQPK